MVGAGAIDLEAGDRRCVRRRLTIRSVIIERVGAGSFPSPVALDDPVWVSYRLAEILPFDTRVKQDLLEVQDAGDRLRKLRALLEKEGLVVRGDG